MICKENDKEVILKRKFNVLNTDSQKNLPTECFPSLTDRHGHSISRSHPSLSKVNDRKSVKSVSSPKVSPAPSDRVNGNDFTGNLWIDVCTEMKEFSPSCSLTKTANQLNYTFSLQYCLIVLAISFRVLTFFVKVIHC